MDFCSACSGLATLSGHCPPTRGRGAGVCRAKSRLRSAGAPLGECCYPEEPRSLAGRLDPPWSPGCRCG